MESPDRAQPRLRQRVAEQRPHDGRAQPALGHRRSSSNKQQLNQTGATSMKIVVFGTGHVGGALVSELAGRGHEVTAVSRSGKAELPAQVAAVIGSVHDPAFLSSVTAGADAIVAALP